MVARQLLRAGTIGAIEKAHAVCVGDAAVNATADANRMLLTHSRRRRLTLLLAPA